MSKIDKLVLLGVLFLVAVIFGVSFYNEGGARGESEAWAGAPGPRDIGGTGGVIRDDREPEFTDLDWRMPPRTGGTDALREDPLHVAVPAPLAADGEQPELALAEPLDRVLDPVVPALESVPPAAAPQGEPVAAEISVPAAAVPILSAEAQPVAQQEPQRESDSLLVTRDGLQPSLHPDFMVYAWQRGDTWAQVAQRYYGDERRANLLLKYNEDLRVVPAGTSIFVPLRDAGVATEEPKDSAGGEEPRVVAATYLVRDGDNLWSIAESTLGSGARWKAIYDLNRDLLPSADALRPGMRLRLP